MVVYYSMLTGIAVLLYLYSLNIISKRVKWLIYMLIILILICVSGLRYYVGTDYSQYMSNYYIYSKREFSLIEQPALNIVAQISNFIYDDYATWFFLMAVITITPVMYIIYKKSISVGLSVLLYILLGCYHFPMNIVKQGAAASIIFLGYEFLKKRNFYGWLVCCSVASLFHITAIFMIPIYFIVENKLRYMKLFLIACIALSIFFMYDVLLNVASFIKQDERILYDATNTFTGSVNILRVLVNCAPILFSLAFKNRWNRNNEDFYCLYNMSFLNAAFSIASMNSIYVSRFLVYTNIFNTLFIPIVVSLLQKRYRYVVLPVMLVLYFVFWSYDLYKGETTVEYHWIFER